MGHMFSSYQLSLMSAYCYIEVHMINACLQRRLNILIIFLQFTTYARDYACSDAICLYLLCLVLVIIECVYLRGVSSASKLMYWICGTGTYFFAIFRT